MHVIPQQLSLKMNKVLYSKILLSKVIKMSTCLLSKRKSMVFSTFVPDIMQQECYEKMILLTKNQPISPKKNHVDQKIWPIMAF